MLEGLEPFNTLYTAVRDGIAKKIGTLWGSKRDWLIAIDSEFFAAFKRWFQGSYADFGKQFSPLKQKWAQLAAAAYLHIAYDLPSVLSDSIRTLSDDDRREAEGVYFSLEDVFRQAMIDVGRQRIVMGWLRWPAYAMSDNILSATTSWAMYLRSVAWTHARFLSELPYTEAQKRKDKMLMAVTAALADVKDWKPWTVGQLNPPHSVVYGFFLPIIPFLLAISRQETESLLLLASLLASAGIAVYVFRSFRWIKDQVRLITGRLITERERGEQDSKFLDLYGVLAFVDELGWRTAEYTHVAVYNPESFEEIRASIRDSRRRPE